MTSEQYPYLAKLCDLNRREIRRVRFLLRITAYFSFGSAGVAAIATWDCFLTDNWTARAAYLAAVIININNLIGQRRWRKRNLAYCKNLEFIIVQARAFDAAKTETAKHHHADQLAAAILQM